MKHNHKFERLSDVAIFCACGEIRESPFVPPVAWPICARPHYPTYYPTPNPYVWPTTYPIYGTVTTGGTFTPTKMAGAG